jgi:hypothetical protein
MYGPWHGHVRIGIDNAFCLVPPAHLPVHLRRKERVVEEEEQNKEKPNPSLLPAF